MASQHLSTHQGLDERRAIGARHLRDAAARRWRAHHRRRAHAYPDLGPARRTSLGLAKDLANASLRTLRAAEERGASRDHPARALRHPPGRLYPEPMTLRNFVRPHLVAGLFVVFAGATCSSRSDVYVGGSVDVA